MSEKAYAEREGSIRFEIGGLDGAYYGSVLYDDAESVGFDQVLGAIAAMAEQVHQSDEVTRLVIGSFALSVHDDPETLEKARAIYADWGARLAERERVAMGYEEALRGPELPAAEGIALLREFAPRCALGNAEDCGLRIVIHDGGGEEAWGWDILHEDGVTTIGCWAGQESPGAVDGAHSLTPAVEAALAFTRGK